jgi:predicted CXXCH cytochrome family protein
VAAAQQLCFRCHPRAQGWASSRSSHDPVRDGDCGACHDPHGGGPKLLARTGGELCATCHDVQAGERARKKGHPPVAQGACRTCHLPHASELEQLGAERIEDLCLRCHGAMLEARAGARLHRPFEARRCGACHVAHGRDGLVRAPNPCAACHSAAVGRWARARARHAPVAEGRCAACHEPHGNDAPRFLRRAGADLCLGCHQPLAKRLAAGTHVHAPARECERCHDAHAAPEPKLLATAVPALCTGCHDVAAQQVVRAHAPFGGAPGRCTGCHDPHVSSRPALIADHQHKPYEDRECASCHVEPPVGARAARPEVSASCDDCHDSAKTSRHEPVRRGRCVACHSPHASPRAHLVLDEGTALCARCHDRRAERWRKIHADAGADGMECADCHDAHLRKG